MVLKTISLCVVLLIPIITVKCAVIDPDEVDQQGLYSKSDHVIIATERNFNRKVYGQKHALVVQFYNSYCAHCRGFAPKFKELANEIVSWKDVVQLVVLDCSVDENTDKCRELEIMGYPTLRYFHENYQRGNGNVGVHLKDTSTKDAVKSQIINMLQKEQSMGRLQMLSPLNIASYSSPAIALNDVPNNIIYTFLILENETSTIGSELILDTNDYNEVRVKRVYDSSQLASYVSNFPGLLVIQRNLQVTSLTPRKPNKMKLLHAINSYLTSMHYVFPTRDIPSDDSKPEEDIKPVIDEDIVYYSDLETALRTALFIEIPRYPVLSEETLNAVIDFLDVIISSFPFLRGNGKSFVIDLRNKLLTKSSFTGQEVEHLVKSLEQQHAPVFVTNLKYVACQGSQSKYRGYSCGLWTLFHTLTVNAGNLPGTEGPKVLRAMYGYIKYFFGCTDCSQHFQQMAARNKIFDVHENDKAVLWLWISHNEVNLRLAGDYTEDPMHPKIQFPRASRCRTCRKPNGAWSLPDVYSYLQRMFGVKYIVDSEPAYQRSYSSASPFSNLDLGMLSFLVSKR